MDQVIAEVRDASNSAKPEDLAKSKITNLLAIQSQRLGQTMSQVKKANQEIEMKQNNTNFDSSANLLQDIDLSLDDKVKQSPFARFMDQKKKIDPISEKKPLLADGEKGGRHMQEEMWNR